MKCKAVIFALLGSFFLSSCGDARRGQDTEVALSRKNYTLILVLAPIDTPNPQVSPVQAKDDKRIGEKNNSEQSQSSKSQLDFSVEFIDLIKKHLLVPGNNYEYKGI